MNEKVVNRVGLLTNSRGGRNTVLIRYDFTDNVLCELDGKIKRACIHKYEPRGASKCYACIDCNSCISSNVASHGGAIRFTPSNGVPASNPRRAEKRKGKKGGCK